MITSNQIIDLGHWIFPPYERVKEYSKEAQQDIVRLEQVVIGMLIGSSMTSEGISEVLKEINKEKV